MAYSCRRTGRAAGGSPFGKRSSYRNGGTGKRARGDEEGQRLTARGRDYDDHDEDDDEEESVHAFDNGDAEFGLDTRRVELSDMA